MNDDELEGKARKVAGKVQEGAGRLTGDERLEGKGVVTQAVGTLQEGYGKVRGKVKDIASDAPGAARDAYATGRDYARRGAETVSRVAADNTALTALVAGTAVAVLGWIVFGRRGKDGKEG